MLNSLYSVLLLDDEPHVLDVLSMAVNWEQFGFAVVETAANAYEALAQIAARRFDLIVTDVHLPQMDGLAFIERVREIDAEVEIIIISGYNRFEYVQRAIRYHVDSYILKPIDPQEVGNQLICIRRRLDIRRKEDRAGDSETDYGDLEEVISYIQKNFQKSISLKSLSEYFFVNASYLGQKFKATTGESFNDYLNKLRIGYVKRFCRAKHTRMNEVIRNAGYANPQYFYKQFKRFEAVSFAEYMSGQSGEPHV